MQIMESFCANRQFEGAQNAIYDNTKSQKQEDYKPLYQPTVHLRDEHPQWRKNAL